MLTVVILKTCSLWSFLYQSISMYQWGLSNLNLCFHHPMNTSISITLTKPETPCHPHQYAEAKKTKSLALHSPDCLKFNFRHCSSRSIWPDLCYVENVVMEFLFTFRIACWLLLFLITFLTDSLF